MWKIAQTRASGTANKAPARPAPAIIHKSRKMISPAYMFPKSRSECDSGLEMYSTKLNRKLSGHRNGLEPNGEQKSSWMKPPTPFTLMAKKIILAPTDNASSNVVDTSALCTMQQP